MFLDVGLPDGSIPVFSTEQVLTGGDSGFSEIEMNPSLECTTDEERLPSVDNMPELLIPESSNFNSRYYFKFFSSYNHENE